MMPDATLSRAETAHTVASLDRDPTGRVSATLVITSPGERP